MPRATPVERFWKFARKDGPNGCWEWQGCQARGGYGHFTLNARTVMAHRWSYEHFVGPIPDGHQIDHLCENRRCVNPDHLEPVLPWVNLQRAASTFQARNAAKTHCPQGHPYSPENTYRNPSGGRVCRTCVKEWDRRQRAKHPMRHKEPRYQEQRVCVMCAAPFATNRYGKTATCSRACANALCSRTKLAA